RATHAAEGSLDFRGRFVPSDEIAPRGEIEVGHRHRCTRLERRAVRFAAYRGMPKNDERNPRYLEPHTTTETTAGDHVDPPTCSARPNGWPLSCGRAGRLPRNATSRSGSIGSSPRPSSAAAC